MQVIRTGDMVGVRYDVHSANDNFEIYNVIQDPQEINNLAEKQGMDSLQQWMKTKVLQMHRPNASAPRPYDSTLVPADKSLNIKAGVTWKQYVGDFPWVPEVATLQATAEGTAGKPVASVEKNNQSGALYFEGYLKMPSDGTYTFYLKSDRGALLRIHDATVIDEDYGYSAGEERQGSINLQAGLHAFRLYFLIPKDGTPALGMEWSGPGIGKSTIPQGAFFQNE